MKINLIRVADNFYLSLKKRGVSFSENGFPIFTKEMLLKDPPQDIVTYKQMNSVSNKSKVAVCFFQEDERLYSRITSLEHDIPKFRKFIGVCGLDLSPNIYWPAEQQIFNILLNQLYTATLAVNGIKIIPNWRIGDLNTLRALNSYPKSSQFAVGTLGSVRNDKILGTFYTRAKAMVSNPSRLLIYGKLAPEYKEELQKLGISFVQYDDTMSRRNILNRRRKYGC